jgi:hypothetical protein
MYFTNIIIALNQGSTSISLNIIYITFYIDLTVGLMHNAVLFKVSLDSVVEK